LFVEVSVSAGAYFERVSRHLLYRSFPEKTYLFSSMDKFVPLLPGVYASLERSWYSEEWTRLLLVDTSAANNEHILTSPDEYQRRYAHGIRESAFVLCPRGGRPLLFVCLRQ